MPLGSTKEERYAALAALIGDSGRSGRWLILTHDNPDPDAIASAVLLARLLRHQFGESATVGYGGLIGRAENRELVSELKVRLSPLRQLSFNNFEHFALVDAQPGTGNNQVPEDVVPDLVFDHHPLRAATARVPFADVRPGYGATVTILAEYLEACGLGLPSRIATGVVYALRSETQEFGREYSAPDKALYDRLLGLVDRGSLARIQNARLPLTYFRNLHDALENLHTVDTLVVSHLGEVEQPDIVPEIADLLLRLQGKTWSLSTGIFNDRLYLSIRTTNPRADAGTLMRRLVGRRGKGGGHGMLAGGWIGLDRAPGGDPRALQVVLGRRLARALRKKPDRLVPLLLGEKSPGDKAP
jgi:nanoRNase/pAp phosphatase (c-di-AMP/oligoRNAs hydrolase)